MRWKNSLLLIVMLLAATSALAYKEPVHRVISLKAFDRTSVDFKSHLGVDRTAVLNGMPFRALVAQGADDEDQGNRSLSHFFDPVHFNAALSVPVTACAPVAESARTWCLDGTGNSYSTRKAREYYRGAVMATNNATRDIYVRELALALGHQIHLVQDMAQPEHTRNDQHLVGSQAYLGGGIHASMYEEWSVVNLLGLNPAVSYDGYPNVLLPTAGDYFAGPGGAGLAQYANRNFVTQDTNYDDDFGKCHYYDEPKVENAVPRTVTVVEAVRDAFGGVHPLPILERIYSSFPTDSYSSFQDFDPNHTFLASFDFETRMLTLVDKYSLADQSMLSRAAFLIPRAVGYSAGFINHFFRGRIDALWKFNPAGGGWDIKITNRSGEAIGADAKVEALYAPGATYLGFPPGSDIAIVASGPLADYVGGFAGIAPGASVTLPNVSIPYLHSGDGPNQFERRVMITGTLGSTPDDVIGLVQPPDAPQVLRAEITWNGPGAPNSLYMEDGQEFLGWYPWRTHDCAHEDQSLADACVSSPANLNPITFTWDPFPPDKQVGFYLGGTISPATYTMTTNIYLNDQLVKTQTKTVTSSVNSSPEFARYP